METSKPVVAWISNSLTPYRLHFFSRVISELPEITLISGFTHAVSDSPWKQDYPAEIRPRAFHMGDSFPVSYTLSTFAREWHKGREMIRWLAAENPKAVIIAGHGDPGVLRVMKWCEGKNIPFFIAADSNIRGDRASGWKAVAKRRLLHWIARRAAGFLVCGKAGRDFYLKYSAAESQIFVSPYTANFKLFRNPDQNTVEKAKTAYGFEQHRRRLVFSGRLAKVKRVDLLIDAFVALASSRPEWDLVIVGDGPLRESLQARLTLEAKHRVTWVGFCENPQDIGAIYRCCDVLVLPSDDEPWGVVVSEAVATGLAVVASDVVGAAMELVKENVNGFRFETGSLQALTTALLKATDESWLARLKAGSKPIFDEWLRVDNPINGLRLALESAGVFADDCQAKYNK